MSDIAPAALAVADTSAAEVAPGADTPAETQQERLAPAWKPPKLKVYNREVEVDEATYHKHAQTGAAFAEQSRRLAQERAELERLRAENDTKYANAISLERLKSDPAGVLKEAGLDPLKWSAGQLVADHEEALLTPEQKAIRDGQKSLQEREAALAAKEKALKDQEERTQQEQLDAARQARRADLGQRFVEALTKGGIPEGPASWRFLESMVEHQTHLDTLVQEYVRTNGAGGVSPEEAAQRGTPEALAELAKEEVMAKDVATWGKLGGADLLHAIPREVGDRYLEARVLEHEQKRAAGGPREPLVPRTAPTPRPAPTQQARTEGVVRDPTNGRYTDRNHREFIDRLGLTE